MLHNAFMGNVCRRQHRNVLRSSLPDFNQISICSIHFMKSQMSGFTKIHRVVAWLIHAKGRRMEERRADLAKLIGAIRDYANAPKINIRLK